MLKYAIIGFGGLGKVHFANLTEIEKQRGDISLTAICNADITSLGSTVTINTRSVSLEDVDFSKYGLYTDYKEMISKEELDFVFIALPTYLHCEVAVYCMEHGLHVFCEKPMAVSIKQCKVMKEASLRWGRKLMIGQCLRFAEEYTFIKDIKESGKYGKAVKARFYRNSPLPGWSQGNWMLDEAKSGGCIVDMAAHDIDIVTRIFGEPDDVYALSTHSMAPYESVNALLSYPETAVQIDVDWGIHSSYDFKSGYDITFEGAHIEYCNGKMKIYTDNGVEEREITNRIHHRKEAEEFVRVICENGEFAECDVSSVYNSMELLFKIKEGAAR